MTGPITTEALVEDEGPTSTEIQAMREEAERFRLPAPAPIPVRDPYYLTECEHCGWVGSSEQCSDGGAPDYDDVVCPVCCSSMCGDAPDEAGAAKHGEAVYQRIVSADQGRDILRAAHQQVTAERDGAISACAEMVRLAEMSFDEAMAEPEESGNYAAFQRAKAACEAAPEVAEAAKTLADQYATLRAEVEAKDRRIAVLTETLVPFADAARWLCISTAPDGIDDGLMVVAEVACRPERTADLSTSHFADARTALARAATQEGA